MCSRLCLFVAIIVSCFTLTFTAYAEDAILSSYETRFAYRGEDYVDRAHNVSLIAAALNGTRVGPGETFSFNKGVGPRTESRGYREAHVIIKGRLVDDWGGGTCQGSGTLHAAVLLAGLEIVEWHPHSRASLYIPPGLDATVSYGSLDFQFRNQFPFEVTIHTEITKPTQRGVKATLRIWLTGSRNVYDVELVTKELLVEPYDTVIFAREDKPKGWKKIIEPGTKRYHITRQRIVRDIDGNVVSDVTLPVKYEPSKRIVAIGTRPKVQN